MTERRHVYPVGDLREHVTEGRDCWCHPVIEDHDGVGEVVIHNSLDGRERYETGELLPH
jgi:hypothetical protein